MAPSKKVAIITGGASGMGYAVSEALTSRGDWDVHIFDMNPEGGNAAAKKLGATFHQVNVSDYNSLGAAFKAVFKGTRRLDFVHANAGIMEKGNFYAVHDTGDEPPPPMPSIVVDIDVMAVVHTSFLAQHYFRQTPKDGIGPRMLLITASCGGFYAVPASPVYGASKHAVVGWTRSIAGRMWQADEIRVNVSTRLTW
jgi:NAD(P)-dependent dehydrogenase (short-subunit alcohol dehydrogenase family)